VEGRPCRPGLLWPAVRWAAGGRLLRGVPRKSWALWWCLDVTKLVRQPWMAEGRHWNAHGLHVTRRVSHVT